VPPCLQERVQGFGGSQGDSQVLLFPVQFCRVKQVSSSNRTKFLVSEALQSDSNFQLVFQKKSVFTFSNLMVVVSYLERLVYIRQTTWCQPLFCSHSRTNLKTHIIISNMFYLRVFIFTRRISV
jgi:hypothetical protein